MRKANNSIQSEKICRIVPPWNLLSGGLAFLIPLMVYWLTLAPDVTLEDSAEYACAAKTLSPAHPPGSPTWVILAHLFGMIPVGTYIQRTNFFSALCVSGAAWCIHHLLWRETRRWDLALSAALVLAFSRCIWGLATVTYNYSLNLLFITAAMDLASNWRRTGRPTSLAGLALIGGLGVGVHHLFILISPVIALYALWGRWRNLFTPRVLFPALIGLLLGLSVLLFLPVRMAQHPPIRWGAIDSFSSFLDYFSRKVYKEAEGGIWYSGSLTDSLRFLAAFFRGFPREQGGLLVLLAIPGIPAFWKKSPLLALAAGGILFFNGPVLLAMGGSTYTPTSEYINRLYYLPATAFLAIFTVFGWDAVVKWLPDRIYFLDRPGKNILTGRTGCPFLSSKAFGTALVLCAPLFPLALNWKACDRSDYHLAREYLENLLISMPDGGMVFPLTNNETFLLAYAHFVEGNPRARLLDRRFGWDEKEAPKALFTAWNVGQSSPHPLTSVLGAVETLPRTILYQVFKTEPLEGLERFKVMEAVRYRISSHPADYPCLSPFERMIFAAYSAYYAGLGAYHHLKGRIDARDQAFEHAEKLNPGDPYCHYLLGQLYHETHTGTREQIQSHFTEADRLFEGVYDPLDTRFYGITRDMIQLQMNAFKEHPLHLPQTDKAG